MSIVIVGRSQGFVKIKWNNAWSTLALSLVPGPQKLLSES